VGKYLFLSIQGENSVKTATSGSPLFTMFLMFHSTSFDDPFMTFHKTPSLFYLHMWLTSTKLF